MPYKYSIVIPTWNKYQELLFPCLQSIIKNTSVETQKLLEIIVVANGCTDDTVIGLRQLQPTTPAYIDVITYPQPIGYTKATNSGIRQATGDYVILMNNDCQILDYAASDVWLQMLEQPFIDHPTAALSGPSKIFSKEINQDFIIFFLTMIKRSIFDKIGYLDEVFSPGSGEDIDFAARAVQTGYTIHQVPEDKKVWEYTTQYPIYHAAEKTVFDLPNWETIFQKNMDLLTARTSQFYYAHHADVTAYVSTKGRYLTTLPMCLTAIANQTLKPKYLIIFQDDHQDFDLQKSSVYLNIFALLEKQGIEWSVVYGAGTGQVKNHQTAVDISQTEWLWRIDDDNTPEPNVLRGLCQHIQPKVGAIASAVVDPKQHFDHFTKKATVNLIKDIFTLPNFQWQASQHVAEAEHLYSSFLYRKSAADAIGGYNMQLSPVGHREETLFTHDMFRQGYQLIVDTNYTTWHLQEATGGIRSHQREEYWQQDEALFKKQLAIWQTKPVPEIVVNLDQGLGDHWMLKKSIEKLLQQNPHKQVVMAVCYPAVYEDFLAEYSNLKLISIAEGQQTYGKDKLDRINVYHFCTQRNWQDTVVKAFEKQYHIQA